MKKALPLLLLITALCFNQAHAQVCVRDSNLLNTGSLLSPAPWSPDSPFYNLKMACINEPYNQSVTINVPEFFTFMGNMLAIKDVSIPTTDGIGNYPTGMTYTCDPPNCVFPAKTLGCILLHGTPAPINPAPDTLDLKLTATVNLQAIPFPIQVNFPGDPSAPNDHYYLILKQQGECTSSSNEPNSPFSALRALPNPVSQITRIEVESKEAGMFQFEVFDLLGNRVYAEKVQLFEGANQFTYDASALASGSYLYSLGNANGNAVRRLIKF